MKDALTLRARLPEQQVAAGTRVIEEGVPMGWLYVLKTGAHGGCGRDAGQHGARARRREHRRGIADEITSH